MNPYRNKSRKAVGVFVRNSSPADVKVYLNHLSKGDLLDIESALDILEAAQDIDLDLLK